MFLGHACLSSAYGTNIIVKIVKSTLLSVPVDPQMEWVDGHMPRSENIKRKNMEFDYYIDETVTMEEHSTKKNKPIRYIRCGCKICAKCWFRKDYAMCIYGGPFSGYEEAEEDQTD